MSSNKPTIIFFGSFLQYSETILKNLVESEKIDVIGVITTPPRPAGRKQILQKTHVHEYALSQNIPVYIPEKLNQHTLDKLKEDLKVEGQLTEAPSLFVVAGYGKLLPPSWLNFPKIAPINIHFSLLPKYRGAMPGEWAILMGETETGVTLIEMSSELDSGNIVAQSNYQLKPTDNREIVYEKLYQLGADLFLDTVEKYLNYKQDPLRFLEKILKQVQDDGTKKIFLPPQVQHTKVDPYARLLSKQDSFIPWSLLQKAQNGQSADDINQLTPLMKDLPTKILTQAGLAIAIEAMVRALYGWPGVWTEIQTDKGKKRMKIHTASLAGNKLRLENVQIEGDQIKKFFEINSKIID